MSRPGTALVSLMRRRPSCAMRETHPTARGVDEVLRRAAAYLSQANLPEVIFPLVREMAAVGARIRMPVAVACRVLRISRQGYYQWLTEPVRQPDFDDAHAISALRDIHEYDPTLGYRFLTDELATRASPPRRTGSGDCARPPTSSRCITAVGPRRVSRAHRSTRKATSRTGCALKFRAASSVRLDQTGGRVSGLRREASVDGRNTHRAGETRRAYSRARPEPSSGSRIHNRTIMGDLRAKRSKDSAHVPGKTQTDRAWG